MEMKPITLCGVPALAWGKDSDRRILAVHGMMSHKADEPIRLLAEAAEKQGIQTVSIDLPGHGDRKGEMALCIAQHCVPELHAMLESLLAESREVGLFGVSLGACFGLMAAAGLPLCQALLVSPVVDMPGLIEGMMRAAGVTPEQLEREKVIPVPDAQPLDWEYYCYVREHRPDFWTVPTAVLIGQRDELEPPAVTEAFCKAHGCGLEQVPGAGHWLHTPEELAVLRSWLEQNLSGCGKPENRI